MKRYIRSTTYNRDDRDNFIQYATTNVLADAIDDVSQDYSNVAVQVEHNSYEGRDLGDEIRVDLIGLTDDSASKVGYLKVIIDDAFYINDTGLETFTHTEDGQRYTTIKIAENASNDVIQKGVSYIQKWLDRYGTVATAEYDDLDAVQPADETDDWDLSDFFAYISDVNDGDIDEGKHQIEILYGNGDLPSCCEGYGYIDLWNMYEEWADSRA